MGKQKPTRERCAGRIHTDYDKFDGIDASVSHFTLPRPGEAKHNDKMEGTTCARPSARASLPDTVRATEDLNHIEITHGLGR